MALQQQVLSATTTARPTRPSRACRGDRTQRGGRTNPDRAGQGGRQRHHRQTHPQPHRARCVLRQQVRSGDEPRLPRRTGNHCRRRSTAHHQVRHNAHQRPNRISTPTCATWKQKRMRSTRTWTTTSPLAIASPSRSTRCGTSAADISTSPQLSGFSIYVEMKVDSTMVPLNDKTTYLKQAAEYQSTDIRIGFLVALGHKAFDSSGPSPHLSTLIGHTEFSIDGDTSEGSPLRSASRLLSSVRHSAEPQQDDLATSPPRPPRRRHNPTPRTKLAPCPDQPV